MSHLINSAEFSASIKLVFLECHLTHKQMRTRELYVFSFQSELLSLNEVSCAISVTIIRVS